MGFKAESGHVRASLSYKLKRVLNGRHGGVLCTDPLVTVDQDLSSYESVLVEADLLIIAAPHREYAGLRTAPVIGLTNLLASGVRM